MEKYEGDKTDTICNGNVDAIKELIFICLLQFLNSNRTCSKFTQNR